MPLSDFTLTIGPTIESSFNTLLRIHEVMQISEPVATLTDAWTEIHIVEEQAGFRHYTAESAVPTGRRNFRRRWTQATGEAVRVSVRDQLSIQSHSFSTSTLRQIRDTGNVLYHRITTEGYKESQDDIQAVSGIAEDIRDALLDYQVCSDKPYARGV